MDILSEVAEAMQRVLSTKADIIAVNSDFIKRAVEIIIDQECVKPSRLEGLYTESSEIVAILTTIAKRAKDNQHNKKNRKR